MNYNNPIFPLPSTELWSRPQNIKSPLQKFQNPVKPNNQNPLKSPNSVLDHPKKKKTSKKYHMPWNNSWSRPKNIKNPHPKIPENHQIQFLIIQNFLQTIRGTELIFDQNHKISENPTPEIQNPEKPMKQIPQNHHSWTLFNLPIKTHLSDTFPNIHKNPKTRFVKAL